MEMEENSTDEAKESIKDEAGIVNSEPSKIEDPSEQETMEKFEIQKPNVETVQMAPAVVERPTYVQYEIDPKNNPQIVSDIRETDGIFLPTTLAG